MTDSLHWHQRIGDQRNWIWRGWQTRYTCVRATQEGSSTPLILLHGFGASIGHWRHNLTELGQHHTVYALDMLGFGASEKSAAPYGVELWVEQVYDFWRTFVRQPVVLVGNSIGSLVCLAVAATHPEMVQGIVMLNLPDSSVLESPRWLRGTIALLSPLSRPALGIAKWIFTSPLVFDPLFMLLRQPRLMRLWAKQAYASPTAITDELLEIFSGPTRDRGAARTLRRMVNAKSKSKLNTTAKVVLPTLQIPMLLFWGLKDVMVPPKLARLFVNYNPNLKLIEIENAGHCPHDECPELVNQEILSWLASWAVVVDKSLVEEGRGVEMMKG
ncbi:MAG: alpha/beta fold hydrolase [Leptolyngbyaceae cyanobacterium RU_5_1]|nr:alpha/beta fold hydrolase [Leptolyngbyaceae cyanobacterium RU_5_1]